MLPTHGMARPQRPRKDCDDAAISRVRKEFEIAVPVRNLQLADGRFAHVQGDRTVGRPLSSVTGMTAPGTGQETRPDATAVVISVAWIVAANKPFYPLYIAYLAPAGFAASAITLLSLPVYVLVGVRGRLAPALLWLVPAAGAADALLAHKAFGAGAGLEAFLAPCAVLAVLVGRERGVRVGRLMLALLGAVFLFLHQWRPLPLAALDTEALVHLRDLNLYSVLGLMFFIGWRALGARVEPTS